MSGENETNKNQGKHQDIPKNVGGINSKEEDTQNYINTAEIKKSKDNLSGKSKIPNLQILSINSIAANVVIFDYASPKYKAEVKATFPELITEMPRDINIKNVAFLENTITLKNNHMITVQVPDLKIHTSSHIEIRNTDFNVSVIKAIDAFRDVYRAIPNINIDRIRPLIEKNITFDSTIMMKINVIKESKMQPIEQNSLGNPENGNNSIIEFPWDKETHKKLFLIDGVSSAENFKIIAVPNDEKYCEFVAMTCRDIYRIEKGGYIYDIARVENINKLDEMFKQTARHEIVIVEHIDISNKDNREYLYEIIKNKAYQDIGFIILVVDNLDKLRKFRDNIDPYDDTIVLGKSDFQPLLENSNALTKIINGFRGRSIGPDVSLEFGDEFKYSEEDFDKEIKKYTDDDFIKEKLKGFNQAYKDFINNKHLLIATRESSEKEASDIHSGMKGFIYVYKIKNGSNEVKFEDGEENADVVADGEYYEAETLFGRKDVTALLAEKMENKYRDENKEVIFTMRNIDIIRNFFSLRNFMEQNKNSKIKICGFDFKQEKLVSMNEIIKSLM